jgi:hypothetical protein
MKQYVIDELRADDFNKIKEYLDEHFKDAAFDGIYWIPIEEELLEKVQREHIDCRPFYFAVELVPESISCELLVRTKNRMRCNCIQYASETQRNWVISFIDSIFERLELHA